MTSLLDSYGAREEYHIFQSITIQSINFKIVNINLTIYLPRMRIVTLFSNYPNSNVRIVKKQENYRNPWQIDSWAAEKIQQRYFSILNYKNEIKQKYRTNFSQKRSLSFDYVHYALSI